MIRPGESPPSSSPGGRARAKDTGERSERSAGTKSKMRSSGVRRGGVREGAAAQKEDAVSGRRKWVPRAVPLSLERLIRSIEGHGRVLPVPDPTRPLAPQSLSARLLTRHRRLLRLWRVAAGLVHALNAWYAGCQPLHRASSGISRSVTQDVEEVWNIFTKSELRAS